MRLFSFAVLAVATASTLGQAKEPKPQPAPPSGATYSAKPLTQFQRDLAANAVEFTKFTNWLNANFPSAESDQRQALKEHLYSIVDSHVKQLHERTGGTYPTERDLILSSCFRWATRMGVFGAGQILQSLDGEGAKLLGSGASAPDSFELSVDGDQLVLSSSLVPWRATFPYYFMIGDLRDIETTNRLRTQMAIISTGFGRNAGSDGWSQATIMLMFSPEGAGSGFKDFWLKKFGFVASEMPVESVGTAAFKRYDAEAKLHTELVFLQTKTGAMAVAYMGLDGTYQWNEAHFRDFLKTLQTGSRE